MLTTLHYYNYYKPYILNNNKKKLNKSATSFKNIPNEREYFMNKALNDNVKSYIFEMSSNFNGLKNISNNLTEKLQTRFMTEPIKEEIEYNIENFTKTYNSFIGFLDENTENSVNFKNVANNIKNLFSDNNKILDKMGIIINENGFLDVKENNNLKTIQRDKETLKEFCSKVYKSLCKLMQDPMCKHMEFKDFSFYFNYTSDFKFNKNKSFKIIEQGLLVDIQV